MTQFQQISYWPWFAATYGIYGVLWTVYLELRFAPDVRKLLLPLGGLMVGIGAFSGFVEDWKNLKNAPFMIVALFLLIVFVWSYRALCVRLIRLLGIDRPGMAERFSFLPLIYILLFAVWVLTPKFVGEEVPPLDLYVWIVLVCMLHVPMFAFGKGEAIKYLERVGVPEAPRERFSSGIWVAATVLLCVPLFITLIVQCVTRDDWRLFGTNVAMTVALLSLLMISNPGSPELKVSKILAAKQRELPSDK